MPASPIRVPPPRWTTEQLKDARDAREAEYRREWREEGPEVWIEACSSVRPLLEELFRETQNLRSLTPDVIRNDPGAWQLLRYVCAPVLSEENFWTLVGSPKSKVVRSEYSETVAEVISLVIDPVRFPWVAANRDPTPQERDAALMATTVLLAAQRVGTGARSDRSKLQELAVAQVLTDAGYVKVEERERIELIDDLDRGTFTNERRVAGAKCDVPVRLHDGRMLLIECKVSFGPKNGWKRLNRETGGKAEGWRNHFGSAAVITAVVLDGVFDLGCLVQAQEQQGVTIFWERQLDPLREFLEEVG